MTFRETLDAHLRAIQKRDLPALLATLPPEGEEIVLIASDGRLVRSVREFAEMHRGWFAMTSWTLDIATESVVETPDLGVAVLHLDYRDVTDEGKLIHETSYLTLVFARRGDAWVMIQDQNTPIKAPAQT